jgi:branched-chain amino acid transport system ATP-binding protein
MPLLVARNLRKTFGGIVAVADASLHVDEGEIVSIIGPNGAGKTSLLNILSGVTRPDRGSVAFEGVELSNVPSHRLAKLRIARTLQNLGLFRSGTVLDNVLVGRHPLMKAGVASCGLRLPGARREEQRNREEAERILTFLEIETLRDRVVGTLPYGVQKRVELGRALAASPKLLLVDELVSGMNLEETAEIAALVLEIRDTLGTAIAMIEHDLAMVMDLSDRIYVLNFGELLAEGTPREIAENPKVIAAYIGSAEGALVL